MKLHICDMYELENMWGDRIILTKQNVILATFELVYEIIYL